MNKTHPLFLELGEKSKGLKMPTVICSYCEYVGNGDGYEEQIADVEAHEKICEEKKEQTDDFDEDEF